MKQNRSEKQNRRLLILSDGKPGHVNQSIAFARHLGCSFDLIRGGFRGRWAKGLSYLLDRIHFFSELPFCFERIQGHYAAVVSAGSETYYANRVLARKMGIKSIAIMLPKGYRYDFDLIVAQHHDQPPLQGNILSVPVNLSYAQPQGLVAPGDGRKVVSLVVGGDSRHGGIDSGQLLTQLKRIFGLFPEHDFWLTTSRRTSAETESVLRQFNFSYAVYFSQQQINPIADFLLHSDYVFLTADSTSMVSEAVSFGGACIEILSLGHAQPLNGKLGRFFQNLSREGCLHWFDGRLGQARRKIDLPYLLKEVSL